MSDSDATPTPDEGAQRAEELRKWRDTVETLDLGSNDMSEIHDKAFFRPDGRPYFPRLHTLFLTGNKLTKVPAVITKLEGLTRLSLKSNLLETVDAGVFPSSLVHLILTDNSIREVRGFGGLRRLRKLMLSGNRIQFATSFLEEQLVVKGDAAAAYHPDVPALELLRLARNNISVITSGDVDVFASGTVLPSLRWISFAGNPFLRMKEKVPSPSRIDVGRVVDCANATELGRGASSVVRRCRLVISSETAVAWGVMPADAPTGAVATLPVAVKAFKAISSDGSAEDETLVLREVPSHEHVLKPLGEVAPNSVAPHGGAVYLIMRFAAPLAKSPTIVSVTEDIFTPDMAKFSAAEVTTILTEVAEAMKAVHAVGISHGDLYAHNVFRSHVATALSCEATVGAAAVDGGGSDAACKSLVASLEGWLTAAGYATNVDPSSPLPARVSDFGAGFMISHDAVVDAHSKRDTDNFTLRVRLRRALEAIEVKAFATFISDLVEHRCRCDDDDRAAFGAIERECGGGALGEKAAVAAGSPAAAGGSGAAALTTFAQVVKRLSTATDLKKS